MAVCARAVQQSDGSFLLGLDPAVTDLSTCAYVVETGSSNAWSELGNMSIENAQLVGAEVGAVWAIAWGFRAVLKSLFNSKETEL
jgi:hypothetical protein